MPDLTNDRDNAPPPWIFRWTNMPIRCTCPDAVKHWERYDAEQERKRLEKEKEQQRMWHRRRVKRSTCQKRDSKTVSATDV